MFYSEKVYNCLVQDRLRQIKVFLLPGIFGLIFLAVVIYILISFFPGKLAISTSKLPEVVLSTIGANGELEVSNDGTNSGQLSKAGLSPSRIAVVSANLAAVYDNNQVMTGIRILGELANIGDGFVESVDPVVRFYNTSGTLVSQKIAQFTAGFDFKEAAPGDKVLYDVTVPSPPTSDRLEIVFNIVSSTASANFLPLKIASRSMELKTADVQSQEASDSAQKVEYYTVSGKVVNTYDQLISDIVIYAWGKNISGRVFTFGRADFKNDLLSPSDKVDFKIIMLPIQGGQKFESYEIAAWGKGYKLLTSPSY